MTKENTKAIKSTMDSSKSTATAGMTPISPPLPLPAHNAPNVTPFENAENTEAKNPTVDCPFIPQLFSPVGSLRSLEKESPPSFRGIAEKFGNGGNGFGLKESEAGNGGNGFGLKESEAPQIGEYLNNDHFYFHCL